MLLAARQLIELAREDARVTDLEVAELERRYRAAARYRQGRRAPTEHHELGSALREIRDRLRTLLVSAPRQTAGRFVALLINVLRMLRFGPHSRQLSTVARQAQLPPVAASRALVTSVLTAAPPATLRIAHPIPAGG